jgi:hypothetical protein
MGNAVGNELRSGSVDNILGVAVNGSVLISLSSGGGAIVLGGRFTLVHGEDPLLPLLSGTEAVDTILASLALNVSELAGHVTKKLKVLSEGLDTLEAGKDVQGHKSLRIHLLPKEHVLAHVVNREVVLQLHGEHVHERERLHVLLVGNSAHRGRVDSRVAIHRVDITWERINNTVHVCGSGQRGRSEGHTVSLLRSIG